MKKLDAQHLQDPREGAIYLLGCEIHHTLPNGEVLKARIVETECYHQEDPASHTFKGQSRRNVAMFGPAGHAYIYFTYGMHWCFNVTAGKKGYGAGILIRAVEPLSGIETMKQLRNKPDVSNLTNGPAKLTQALVITKSLYGHNLAQSPLQLFEPTTRYFEVVGTTRIGISQAVDEVARFYIKTTPLFQEYQVKLRAVANLLITPTQQHFLSKLYCLPLSASK